MNATYKLHVVATHEDYSDTHERVAVQLIREIKAEHDMPAELDRAALAVLPAVHVYQNGDRLNSLALRLAFACDILADEQETARRTIAPGCSFVRSRAVVVNGQPLRLTWHA